MRLAFTCAGAVAVLALAQELPPPPPALVDAIAKRIEAGMGVRTIDYRPGLDGPTTLVIGPRVPNRAVTTARDSLLLRLIGDALTRQAPDRLKPTTDSAHAVHLTQVTVQIRGDTADVRVVLEQCAARVSVFNLWSSSDQQFYVKKGDGWEFVRRGSQGAGDGRCA